MELIVLNIPETEHQQASDELDKHLRTFGLTGSDEELLAARSDHTPPEPTHAVVVDGETLKLMLSDELKQKFLLLCKQCKAVLCCRVSPAQKAAVVSMVKNGLNIMALSVGDGANDVANAWATSVSSRSVTYRQAMVCPHESKSILERILILKLLYSCGTHADHAIDTLSDIRDDRCSGCRCQNCFHNQGVLRTER